MKIRNSLQSENSKSQAHEFSLSKGKPHRNQGYTSLGITQSSPDLQFYQTEAHNNNQFIYESGVKASLENLSQFKYEFGNRKASK